MVTRDRGQLILVGAIAIALILLGLVLIINTALFTQVVGSEGTVESAKEGGVSGQEIGNSIGAVVAEENLREDSYFSIENDVQAAVDDDLEPLLANRSVEGTGSFVSAQYLERTEDGRVIEQTSTDSVGDWDPVSDGEVGHFNMTIDTVQSDGGDFDIVVVDSSTGSSETLTVVVNDPGEISISSTATGTICSNEPVTNDTARIDVRHGTVYENGNCQFDLFPDSEQRYDVSIEDLDDDVRGTYTIVTDDTASTLPGSPLGSPNESPAVWAFAYEFTYDSPASTFESERREVEVYD